MAKLTKKQIEEIEKILKSHPAYPTWNADTYDNDSKAVKQIIDWCLMKIKLLK